MGKSEIVIFHQSILWAILVMVMTLSFPVAGVGKNSRFNLFVTVAGNA